jgi:DnaJ-class molecular chaperone
MTDQLPSKGTTKDQVCTLHDYPLQLGDCRTCRGDGQIEVEDDYSSAIVGFVKCYTCGGSGTEPMCVICEEEDEFA